eukprot:EG_transcript_20374
MADSWEELLRSPRVLVVVPAIDDVRRLVVRLRDHCNRHVAPSESTSLGRPFLYIADMAALDEQLFPTPVVPVGEAGGPTPAAAVAADVFSLGQEETALRRMAFDGGGVLALNCDNFSISDLESLNSLLDYGERRFLGRGVVAALHIVGFVTEETVCAEKHTSPFYERFHRIALASPSLAASELPLNAVIRPCTGAGSQRCIDLQHSPHWPQLLLGSLQLDAQGLPRMMLGPLAVGCLASGPPLCLHRPSPAAALWLEAALQDGGFRFNGQRFGLPAPGPPFVVAASPGSPWDAVSPSSLSPNQLYTGLPP